MHAYHNLRVNAQGGCPRTVEEIKKKLSDLKTSTKKRERERRREQRVTGGGPAPHLERWEEEVGSSHCYSVTIFCCYLNSLTTVFNQKMLQDAVSLTQLVSVKLNFDCHQEL